MLANSYYFFLQETSQVLNEALRYESDYEKCELEKVKIIGIPWLERGNSLDLF